MELTLKVGILAVNLASLAVGQIVKKLTFVKEFWSRKLALSICFIVFYLTSVEASISPDEKCLIALSNAIVEAALVNGTIIVDNSSIPMRYSIFPLSFVVSGVGK